GSAFTYAAPSAAEGTATGQVSARPLRQTYRMDRFSKSAKVYGVIASPVRHSVSPAVQNRAFQARRIEAVYLPFLVQPAQLKDFFVFAEKLPVSGFSVTIPHKQKALRYLDAVDGLARRIGAVNTVWRRSGRWRGTNTDAPAVIAALSSHVTVPRSSVLIAGNGGAARAAACALAEAGAKLSLVGRNRDRVRMLARVCGAEPLGRDQLAGRRFDVLVHATPLGMYPHVNESFFPGEIPADVIFDMVYNPIETALIRNARQQSKKVVTGMEMFLEQAARQFEIWTGETPPRQLMQRAAIEALENAREVSPGSHDSPAAPAHARSAANR
ncbi:MAG: shikimate dehydrogenase, partial [Acidobacteria bacterium]|nr:shikimate dehydrogenase [Acidobacteriota bacterium]